MLSVRKQFCLQFLKWAYTKKAKDKAKVVELAKLWRKEPGRIGNHRTVLEKKARKFFKQDRKLRLMAPQREGARKFALKQGAEGTGKYALTAEQLRENSRKANAAIAEKGAYPHVSDWLVYPPDGEPFKIHNLRKFCRENGLDQRHLIKTATMKRAHHKGWRAEKLCSEWDEL